MYFNESLPSNERKVTHRLMEGKVKKRGKDIPITGRGGP
jgi:hypothetical protein